jgi:Voltage gated chloride channel
MNVVDHQRHTRGAVQAANFTCPEGQHNDLATAFYNTDDNLLSRFFSVGQDYNAAHDNTTPGFTPRSLLIYSSIYLVMMALASGICVPAGLFMPAVMLGASAGLNCGLFLQRHLPPSWHIQPGALRSCLLPTKRVLQRAACTRAF